MVLNDKVIPLVYLNNYSGYISNHILNKIRGGDYVRTLHVNLDVIDISIMVDIIYQLLGVDAFVVLQKIAKYNVSTVDPRSVLNLKIDSRTVLVLKIHRVSAIPHQLFVD